ncbi:FecCD family ABC transporter permease [Planctomonas psychrotolerans]|uniref:FecCD family ABC transporter permease n=1 Tax=Planctomonas psychrotolerans TaxID=2528712 RepID=UPI001D0D4A41|nr:iron chelate uptake ABC transporter family permease subunit [Planctomonas psychrotolerans]
MSAVILPAGTRVLRLAGGRLSLRVDRRGTVVVLALTGFVLGLAALAVTLGEYPLTLGQIVGAFAGTESDGVRRIVVDGRLPRIVMAAVAGAALALSGAIFQSMTRNPLGSPDIIGFTTGAYTGALLVTLVVGGNYIAQAWGALAGGLAAAILVYVLAYTRGVQGFRLIVVGIAVSAMLHAVNGWLILRARLEEALAAATWGAGSFNEVGWRETVPVLVAVAVLVPLLVVFARPLALLEMGDDAARSLGVRPEVTRGILLVVGVALVAAITAAAGPISFVALAAPQLARRLARSAGVSLLPSAAMGAALLLASDVLAQRLLAPTQLPVGVITVCVGGVYLVALLISQARRQ